MTTKEIVMGGVVDITKEEYEILKDGFEAGAHGSQKLHWLGIQTPSWKKWIRYQQAFLLDGTIKIHELLKCGEWIWGSCYDLRTNNKETAQSPNHPMFVFRSICLKLKGADGFRVMAL